jgi:hypothetical protein
MLGLTQQQLAQHRSGTPPVSAISL